MCVIIPSELASSLSQAARTTTSWEILQRWRERWQVAGVVNIDTDFEDGWKWCFKVSGGQVSLRLFEKHQASCSSVIIQCYCSIGKLVDQHEGEFWDLCFSQSIREVPNKHASCHNSVVTVLCLTLVSRSGLGFPCSPMHPCQNWGVEDITFKI